MSTEKITNVVALLKQAKPAEIAELEFVKDRFVTIHNQIHGTDKGELIYHKEVFNYKKLLSETPALRECSPLSLYGCFLDINVNGHSLEQGSKPDCYITPKNFKVGTDAEGRDVWEKRATLQVSPYGEVKMRMRAGQIKHADNPIVVYDCDHFKIGTNNNGKLVVKEYDKTLPKPDDAKIVACFVRIERPDGSFEMPFLDMDDIARLRGYSEKQNKGKANALYGTSDKQIDTGFLKAKTLKHALMSYPKVPTGKFTALEPLEEIHAGSEHIDYGIDANDHSGNAAQFTDYSEVKTTDDFENAVNAENEESIETVVFADDDEPSFD
jgi:recombinational DNA repair protein RecT